MYNYDQINSVHIELSAICQARCPMCARNELTEDSPKLKDQIYLSQFQSWFPVEFLKQVNCITFCGNIGEPILARDFIEIVKYIREIKPTMFLRLNTNGSARTTKWWEEISKYNIYVIFGIDGLEDTHHLYRVDTNWKKIIENAKAFIGAGGSAQWDMLVFKHNQHQIDTCQKMSEELGFEMFNPVYTNRFGDKFKYPVFDRNKNISHIIEPATITSSNDAAHRGGVVDNVKSWGSRINCRVKENKDLYISANGDVSPCCWLGFDWRKDIDPLKIDYIKKGFTFHNLNHITLEDIFKSGYFEKIEQGWSSRSTCLKVCKQVCGTRL